jgi:hypothetical protein
MLNGMGPSLENQRGQGLPFYYPPTYRSNLVF